MAARQHISCEEVTKSKSKHTVTLNIDPSAQLDVMWRHDASKGGDYIVTYTQGDQDAGGKTTARVTITVPGSKKADPFEGKFPFSDYYEVNKLEKPGSGYSYKFGGKAYRSTHGHDKNMMWDMMVYYPEEIVGQNATDFQALITIQNKMMDQGYYHIDMNCDSSVRAN
jgi:hypothetical protein